MHVILRRFDAAGMLRAVADHGVSHVFTMPAVIDRMAKPHWVGRARKI